MLHTILILLLGLAACARGGANTPEETERSAAPGPPSLEFSARELPAAEQVSQPTARAEGGEGRMAVQGRLAAPDPCRKVTGALESGARELTLRVEVAPGAEVCIQRIASFAYDATVTGLAPGTYRLRVVHTYPQTGWETRAVLEEQVTVR